MSNPTLALLTTQRALAHVRDDAERAVILARLERTGVLDEEARALLNGDEHP